MVAARGNINSFELVQLNDLAKVRREVVDWLVWWEVEGFCKLKN